MREDIQPEAQPHEASEDPHRGRSPTSAASAEALQCLLLPHLPPEDPRARSPTSAVTVGRPSATARSSSGTVGPYWREADAVQRVWQRLYPELQSDPASENSHWEKPYKCNECEKAFIQKPSLVNIREATRERSPIGVMTVAKSSARAPTSSSTQRIHEGEALQEVQRECGKAFHNSSRLIHHQRSHHGEKPYKCADCKKAFSQGTYLLQHRRIHTGRSLTVWRVWQGLPAQLQHVPAPEDSPPEDFSL